MTVIRFLYRSENKKTLIQAKRDSKGNVKDNLMNLLVKQISHPDVSVKQMAISILEEISSNTENFKTLVRGNEITPDNRSTQLMMQYLKTDEGFHFLKQLGWVDE